jgi:hypothetical protein
MRTFTQITEHLKITRPDWSRRVRALAARFHLGVESEVELWGRTHSEQVYKHALASPTLSEAEVRDILTWRDAQ